MFLPLFSAFGPDPINQRLNEPGEVPVTTKLQYRKKVADLRKACQIKAVILTDLERPGT
jgi:hypothetical protein